jgi:phasin family protein
MITPEQIQQYGKEQYETAVESAGSFQRGCQAIATTVGDYTKKSFGEGNAFVEKLSGVKSLDKAMEAHAEYARSAQEAFVAESQKVAELYADLAKQAFKPFEGLFAKMTPSR